MNTTRPTRRRPAWVAAGVASTLSGALAAALLVAAAGGSTTVMVASADIPAGRLITADDVRQVEASVGPGARTVSDASVLVGSVAADTIRAGDVLNADDVVDSAVSLVAPGRAVVGAELGPGALPISDLGPGRTVLVLATGGLDGPRLLGRALVFDAVPTADPERWWVSLDVPESIVVPVAAAAASGALHLAVVADSPPPEASSTAVATQSGRTGP